MNGVAGVWKDLTDSVNSMAGNLTNQVRNIAEVTTAVAKGDLSTRISVDARGEILQLKNTINTMVDQLSSFAAEVTRVAREVGTEGLLGGEADVPGVGGTWKDLTDSVNSMAGNLTAQVRNIAEVTTAVAKGDLSRKITVTVRGEILELKNTINTMVDQLSSFASEVTRVAREVGTEGKLGGQAEVEGVAGTWRDLTDSVNSMAGNLTNQVRNIAGVTTAVAKGDLSTKITVDARGEILELKNTINTMVDQLNSFASEVTRVAREVGTEGKLGGQAQVKGVGGVWKDLTDSVNSMAGNLTDQVRNIAEVTTAVAKGDLSRKITVDVRGEILELKNTINTMVDQLNSFASEVTRVAREVGTDGKLGGQAQVKGVGGVWKDLTDSVNFMAGNLTAQVRNIAEVTTAVANGDLSRKITVDVRGEILELKNTINTMVDQLNAFASEVTRVAREVGTEGKLGGQAEVKGVAGTWKDLTDSVNSMASNLTTQVRNIAEVTTAVATGDLSRKITVDVRGEILELKNTINTMVDQLSSFACEVTRVAREVGTEGKLGGQADVHGVAGTWKDLTDSVNSMASNLTSQVRNIAEVTTAVAKGDLSRKITVDVRGEILELKNTINTMVDQLNAFAGEVTRVAREVGTEGKLGGQAEVKGVGGVWKDLTDSVNFMAGNLTSQVRNIAQVTTGVAKGDLSTKITVDARGEILELKNTINTMVDQLNGFASEVTRVAREVGTEGKLGGQADVRGVAGTWKDLTDSVNYMASNLTNQVRNIAGVTTAVARGDLTTKITVDARGEILALKNTINTMVDQLSSFASEVTRVAREVGTEGKLGGQAEVKGVAGTWKDLDGKRELHGGQPDQSGPQHRRSHHGGGARRFVAQDHGRRARRNSGAEEHHQHDGGSAQLVRLGSDARGARSRHRRQTRRPGRCARRRRNLERSDGQREFDGRQSYCAGPQHRAGDDRGRQRQSLAQDHGGRARRDSGTEEHHQHHGGSAQFLRQRSDARGARSGHRRQAGRPGGSERRRRNVEGFDRQRELHGRESDDAGARHRQGGHRGRQWRSETQAGSRNQRRDRGTGRHHQRHDRYAGDVRRSGDYGGARSRHRGQTGRPGARAGRRRHLARSDGQRQPARRESHHSGPRDRRSRDGRYQGRSDAFHRGGGAGRSRRAERQHQRDDRQSGGHHAQEQRAGLAEDQHRQVHRHDAGPARPADGLAAPAFRADAAGRRPARNLLHRRHGGGNARAETAGRICDRRAGRCSQAVQDRAGAGRPVRQGEGAHPGYERAERLCPDQFQPGRSAPLSIVVLPVLFEGDVKAAIELASFAQFSDIHLTFLDQLTQSIGIVLNTIAATMRTEQLLQQSQALAEELQSQQLQLQTTNAELQEKAQLLAEQKTEVETKNQEVEQAKKALEEKAEQLALTSKYKSEFLANMSHELRTPLNNLLILARMLSENSDKNLTSKQVKFAETIHTSGTDLLALISDILDLSKIESGKMDVEVGGVRFTELQDYCSKTFRHVAEGKGLDFTIEIGGSLSAEVMHTDAKRLQQVLKNLLSNALKFTEHGSVRLTIDRAAGGWSPSHTILSRAKSVIAFSVTDTGIGIQADKQRIIFEAFQQADGTTSRKYGGTGLGTFDQPRTGAPAGRRDPPAERARRRQHLHSLSAADVRHAGASTQERSSDVDSGSAGAGRGQSRKPGGHDSDVAKATTRNWSRIWSSMTIAT